MYADPNFLWLQMYEIRNGQEDGVDVSIYADPKFSWRNIFEIRVGLQREKGLR